MNHKVQVWIARGSDSKQVEVLLFKVIEKRGGGWHPITGGVDPGEDLFAAAIRETHEETQLDLSYPQAKWMNLNYSFRFESNQKWRKGPVEEHAFGLWFKMASKDFNLFLTLDPSEHTEAKWVGLEEALRLLAFPNQKAALKLFYEQIGAQQNSKT